VAYVSIARGSARSCARGARDLFEALGPQGAQVFLFCPAIASAYAEKPLEFLAVISFEVLAPVLVEFALVLYAPKTFVFPLTDVPHIMAAFHWKHRSSN
jgi:hypothetical protein